jgi:hypothetical protein
MIENDGMITMGAPNQSSNRSFAEKQGLIAPIQHKNPLAYIKKRFPKPVLAQRVLLAEPYLAVIEASSSKCNYN